MAQPTKLFVHASWRERRASLVHEAPEPLHLEHSVHRKADDFGLGAHAEDLLGSAKAPFVDEEGLALQVGAGGHDQLSSTVGIHSGLHEHTSSSEHLSFERSVHAA